MTSFLSIIFLCFVVFEAGSRSSVKLVFVHRFMSFSMELTTVFYDQTRGQILRKSGLHLLIVDQELKKIRTSH